MIPLTLGSVAAAVGGSLLGGADPSSSVTGISTDSRSVAGGDLFVAVVGEHHDAHDFAGAAVAAGAAAVLASRELDVPCVDLAAAFSASATPELSPRAPNGETRWAASPQADTPVVLVLRPRRRGPSGPRSCPSRARGPRGWRHRAR